MRRTKVQGLRRNVAVALDNVGVRHRGQAATVSDTSEKGDAKRPIHSAAEFIPDRPTLSKVRDAAKQCRACHLWKLGTQTVFGEGASHARLMFVGEQPGNEED